MFTKHRRHIVGADSSCSTCHAPHGIQGGSIVNNRHLVDFDRGVVGPDRNGRLYIDTASRTCYLRCHGKNHNGLRY